MGKSKEKNSWVKTKYWGALGAPARGRIWAHAQGKALPCTLLPPPVKKVLDRPSQDRMSPFVGDFFPMEILAKGDRYVRKI